MIILDMREENSLYSHWVRILINFIPKFFIFPHPHLGFMANFSSSFLDFEFLSLYKNLKLIHGFFQVRTCIIHLQHFLSHTFLTHFTSFLAHFSCFIKINLILLVWMYFFNVITWVITLIHCVYMHPLL